MYGATYTRNKPQQNQPPASAAAQASVNAVASSITGVNKRIFSILEQLTNTPDMNTKKITLERINILRDELNAIFK